MKPRACQIAAVEAALRSLDAGSPDVIEMVTGSGKSIAMALLIRRLRARGETAPIVVVTSRTELVESLSRTLARILDPVARDLSDADRAHGRRWLAESAVVGRYDGHSKRICPVTVTTYPSLARCLEGVKDPILLCDEAHRSRAKRAGARVRAVPRRIGWTATPYPGEIGARLPGWSRVAYSYTAADAIDAGVIVPFDLRSGVEAVEEMRSLDVVIGWLADVEGAGLVTAPNLTSAQEYARTLTAAGYPAVAAVRRSKLYPDGLTPRELRAAYRAAERGELRALVTVDLLAEGVDLPWLRWLALCARPRGRIHLVQVVGRVVRVCPGKERAIVLDPSRVLTQYSLTHTAALGEEVRREKRVGRERARALRLAAVVASPWAVRVSTLSRWSEALLDQARTWAVARSGMTPGQLAEKIAEARRSEGRISVPVGLREVRADVSLMAGLRQGRGLVRWIAGDQGEEHRRAIEAVMNAADVPAGVVSDLRQVLRYVAARRDALRAHGQAAVRVHGWLRVVGVAVPAVDAVGAYTAFSDRAAP